MGPVVSVLAASEQEWLILILIWILILIRVLILIPSTAHDPHHLIQRLLLQQAIVARAGISVAG